VKDIYPLKNWRGTALVIGVSLASMAVAACGGSKPEKVQILSGKVTSIELKAPSQHEPSADRLSPTRDFSFLGIFTPNRRAGQLFATHIQFWCDPSTKPVMLEENTEAQKDDFYMEEPSRPISTQATNCRMALGSVTTNLALRLSVRHMNSFDRFAAFGQPLDVNPNASNATALTAVINDARSGELNPFPANNVSLTAQSRPVSNNNP